ncbi:MAG TPA: sugar phosphate isomerase/epimerase [Chitinophagaceae bacterium]|nr:sugar phosphate isomerase/epimerase [Chitinophagaceae bacterium]
MPNRRHFIKQAGALGFGGLLLNQTGFAQRLFQHAPFPPIGIQLYTLSGLMATDTKGTLQKVAQIGYKELESAATPKGYYYGFTPKAFAAMVNDMGMHWRSQHVMGAPFDMARMQQRQGANPPDTARARQMAERLKFLATLPTLKNNYQQLADEAAEGGLSYLVCASIPVNTLDEIKTAADVFNKAGDACKKAGVQFAYHNHTTEFDLVEGQRPFDYILANTDKEAVKMELDLAWATKAGQDPATLFAQHPSRFPLWHTKDIDKVTKNPVEVGKGYVDFKGIFAQAAASGLKYFFVEQDGAPNPIQNITTSYANLKKIVG